VSFLTYYCVVSFLTYYCVVSFLTYYCVVSLLTYYCVVSFLTYYCVVSFLTYYCVVPFLTYYCVVPFSARVYSLRARLSKRCPDCAIIARFISTIIPFQLLSGFAAARRSEICRFVSEESNRPSLRRLAVSSSTVLSIRRAPLVSSSAFCSAKWRHACRTFS
jgi:hypothetical protein